MLKKTFSLSGLVVLLIAVSIAGILYKNRVLGVPLFANSSSEKWLVEARVSYQADAKPVTVSLALPQDGQRNRNEGQQISIDYGFSRVIENGESSGVWSARSPKGRQLIYYRTLVEGSEKMYEFPQSKSEVIPEIPEFNKVRANVVGGSKSMALRRVYEQTMARSADDVTFVTRVQELIEEEPNEDAYLILKRFYERKYEEDWRRPLVVDLLRLAGIPCERCFGVRLEEERGARDPVGLLEYFDRSEAVWRVILPNGGSLKNIYVWSRTDTLLEVSGGRDSSVQFTVIRERAPTEVAETMSNAPWFIATISALPASERAPFRYAALIPLGVLAVVILRNVIGLATLGTFMPVLLALAFLELPLVPALIMFSSMLFGGLVFRAMLSKFHLLVVPRVAACVVIVTLFMMGVSLLSYKLGAVDGLRVTVFPMIVLAWTIERMSLIWDEEGAFSALYQILGSLIAALAAFGMMEIEALQYWVEFFPEVLLILLAIILLLGRYTGYRLFELFRFKNAASFEG